MILKCKNMTNAIRANKLLNNNKIKSRLEKISDDPEIRGCVYSVVIDDNFKNIALDILCKNNISFHKKEKAYCEGEV